MFVLQGYQSYMLYKDSARIDTWTSHSKAPKNESNASQASCPTLVFILNHSMGAALEHLRVEKPTVPDVDNSAFHP